MNLVATRDNGLAPVLRSDAKLLLLGSFPGKASLSEQQYYAHPRNQFWPIVGELIGVNLMRQSYQQRLASLQQAHLALWDVLGSCIRPGSLDASIRDAATNAFDEVLAGLPVLGAVAFNGAMAAKHAPFFQQRGLQTYALPSTSPAHASLRYAQKLERWSVLVTDGWMRPVL